MGKKTATDKFMCLMMGIILAGVYLYVANGMNLIGFGIAGGLLILGITWQLHDTDWQDNKTKAQSRRDSVGSCGFCQLFAR